MKLTQKQVTAKVLKKVSALRQTLSNEERAILDRLMGVQEVEAHRLAARSMSKSLGKVAKKTTKTLEVQANSMTGKAFDRALSKVTRTTNKVRETTAHRIVQRPASKAILKTSNQAAKTLNRVAPRVSYDQNSEEYKVQ